MKRLSLIFTILITLIVSSRAGEPVSADDFIPVITFEKNVIDLGEMADTVKAKKFEFIFVNTGNAPLVLTYVHASCSCVRLEYPRQPIAPGDTSRIAGTLNTATIHQPEFKRNILVRSTAQPSQTRLFITGKIRSVKTDN